MLSLKTIEELTKKYQTTEVNVAREYCQHLFLSHLYQKKSSEFILFKGGTALRIIYRSPRFSEDLDFSCFDIKTNDLEEIILNTISEIENTGIKIEIKDAKVTSGGYLGMFYFDFLNFKEAIRIECSFRGKARIKPEVILVNSDYIPPFNIFCLPFKHLIKEKINALLERTKPRDFYDAYFLLRMILPMDKANLNLDKILQKLDASKIDFKKELSLLLSQSHHTILKDFKNILRKEIKKYGY